VSVQVAVPDAGDEKDKVLIQTATITDENGEYSIFVQPGTYNLVFSKAGFLPDCAEVIAEEGFTTGVPNFTLFPETASGTVTGTVNINGATGDQHVTLSFRQIAQCDGDLGDETIEVKALNVAHDSSYTVELPVGTYTLVSSTYGEDTQVIRDLVIGLEETILNIDFPASD